jgi:predicted RNA-binding protein with PUA-like domain
MAMKKGDLVLIYHSNAKPSGIIGLGRVTKEAVADPTQFDKKSEYYDAKSVKEKPRWFCPEISFVEKFEKIIPLDSLKTVKALKKMPLLQRGSRLSVQPVQDLEFKVIKELSKAL